MIRVTGDGERVELAVPLGRSDAVLAIALRRGWSVLAVETAR